MPLAVKLTLVTNNFLDVVAELIAEKIVAPRSKMVELSIVADRLLAVEPILTTDNLPFVVIGPMVGLTAAPPQAKMVERMKPSVVNHMEQTTIPGQQIERVLMLESE
jgi:hypothetical protein